MSENPTNPTPGTTKNGKGQLACLVVHQRQRIRLNSVLAKEPARSYRNASSSTVRSKRNFVGGIWLRWWQYSHGAWNYSIGQLDPTAPLERDSSASAGLGWQPDAAGKQHIGNPSRPWLAMLRSVAA